jgi:Putative Actinobacterial Holin-X, holin superfamily III
MADQATLIRKNGSRDPVRPSASAEAGGGRSSPALGTEAAAGQVVSGVAGFGENMLNLAELQARMAAIELRQNVDTMKTAGAVLVGTVVIAVAAFPILLASIAELLVSEAGWRRGYALLTVGLATIGIAAFGATTAVVWLRRQRFGFPLSIEEFTRNLNWVHTVLRLSGRRPTRRS